jgi:acyl CoA:acetate/3-ketoacid CoA transferase beta subunit
MSDIWGKNGQCNLCVSQEKKIINMHHMLRKTSSKKMHDNLENPLAHPKCVAICDQSAI